MEARGLKVKNAGAGVVIGLVVAQLAGVLVQTMNSEPGRGGGGSPLIWVVVALMGVLAAVAIMVVVMKKRSAGAAAVVSSAQPGTAVGVLVGMALLVAGAIAGLVVFFAVGKDSAEFSSPPFLIIASVIGLVVVLLFFGVVLLFVTGTKLSVLALPDHFPRVETSADPVFGKRRGSFGGTWLLKRRVMGIRVPVYGRGYDKRTGGSVWLADEAIAFLPSLSRTPIVIPYALIHALNRKETDGKPWLSVVWGRPELPMETTIQITGKPQETDLWAQEISRRAAAWKAKAKASR